MNTTESRKLVGPTQISFNDICDLFITALEGGSNYWYLLYTDEFEKELPPAGTYDEESGNTLYSFSERLAHSVYYNNLKVNVYDIENPEELLGTLSQQSIIDAFSIMKDKYPKVYKSIMPYEFADEEPDYDAESADIFFQLAVMGDIIFG